MEGAQLKDRHLAVDSSCSGSSERVQDFLPELEDHRITALVTVSHRSLRQDEHMGVHELG